jgi:hypothetical protein
MSGMTDANSNNSAAFYAANDAYDGRIHFSFTCAREDNYIK